MRAIALVFVFLVGSIDAQQGTRDTRSAPTAVQTSIAGTVVSDASGRPIPRATVTVAGNNPKTAVSVPTNEDGTFKIVGLPAGEYTLTASKPGYIESIYGQKQPGSGRLGTPIRLLEGQELTRLTVPLPRGGAITGTVRDETGEPAFGITVRAMRWVLQSGERILQMSRTTTTDDRGVYRLHSLLPGEYLIATASTQGGFIINAGDGYAKVLHEVDAKIVEGMQVRLRLGEGGVADVAPANGYATMFYPGTRHGSTATAVTIAAGEEQAGIDLSLQLVPLAQVAGTVVNQTVPASGSTVQLVDTMQPAGFGARTARTDANGRFSFYEVPPGQYRLTTRATPRGAPRLEASAREAVEFLAAAVDRSKAETISATLSAIAPLWASTDVTVDGRHMRDIQLILQPGITVSGRLAFEGAGQPPNTSRLTLGLMPLSAGATADAAMAGPAPVDASGDFAIRGVAPGRYRLTILGGAPPGFSLMSAVFGGQDVLDAPMEIDGARDISGGIVTLSATATEVSGVIRDAANQGASGVTVIVFAAEERFWTPMSRRIQAVRPSTDGHYRIRNLPPGNYRLTAVPDVEPGRWFDPAFLRKLAGFTTFALTAGGKHTQDFQVR